MSGQHERGGRVGDWRWREEDVAPDLTHDLLGLLRGCFLRSVGWSVVVGLLFNVGYLVLLFLFRIAAGVGTGWAVWPLVLLAAAQGAAVGLGVGVATGLALASVTLVSFVTCRWAMWCRHVLGAICAVVTMLVVWGGQQATGLPYLLVVAGPEDLVLGLTIVGLGGWWVGVRVARWVAEAGGWEP